MANANSCEKLYFEPNFWFENFQEVQSIRLDFCLKRIIDVLGRTMLDRIADRNEVFQVGLFAYGKTRLRPLYAVT